MVCPQKIVFTDAWQSTLSADPSFSLDGFPHSQRASLLLDIKDITRCGLDYTKHFPPHSRSLAYTVQEFPTVLVSGFLLGSICPAESTGCWGKEYYPQDSNSWGGDQHDLGSADLFTRSLSRDPILSYKKFAKTVMILFEGNLLNIVRLYIVNKRSLLCALYVPHKVYLI